MHDLAEPSLSADDYRHLCLSQLRERGSELEGAAAPATAEEVEALVGRLGAARRSSPPRSSRRARAEGKRTT